MKELAKRGQGGWRGESYKACANAAYRREEKLLYLLNIDCHVKFSLARYILILDQNLEPPYFYYTALKNKLKLLVAAGKILHIFSINVLKHLSTNANHLNVQSCL